MPSDIGVSNLGVSGFWHGGKGDSPLRLKVLWCPPHHPRLPGPVLPPPYNGALYSSESCRGAGGWETLGISGEDKGQDFLTPWPRSGDGEGTGANPWSTAPSFYSSRWVWSFLPKFLSHFWEIQMEKTQYLGQSLRSSRIFLKDSQSPGPRSPLPAKL